ncbi:hypothetical protein OIU83_03025 [Flavobacterium sp. LS1R49]|uniref:Uncharacterized protein n=1 Tax=Flavobacterium shii TaxID=2987687 RepID=A0A9X2Z9K4_9FLAO|nr:hypothetical protein [Flavobacterium shii]MCV9926604.1 hypothetical protein [Flavobacterium shii]
MYFIISILFSIFNLNSQSEEKTYFGRSHNYSAIYSYSVAEIHISSDSTMTRYDYRLPNKREWKNYKNYEAKKEVEIISKKGKYYSLINPVNHLENEMHCVKITDSRLTYYYKAPDGSFIKGFTFKRK